MLDFVIAAAVIMAMLGGWILVQQMARRFARRHPEFGPYTEKRGCGGNCSCAGGESCQKK
ncbi:MAG TPA: chemotaxis protein [Sedimenticola thiotaurini]|uniref:Chemotaxis protein n=1 Tax=Sedimenticola thiotaurini TaxID=1543721 RepID=A0A831RM04_9GAMM|nr:chemotaxis protein [Sedimenticola thiotaurini]